jgi:hypothetical protein
MESAVKPPSVPSARSSTRSSPMVKDICGSARVMATPSAIVSSPSERIARADADQSADASMVSTSERSIASLS